MTISTTTPKLAAAAAAVTLLLGSAAAVAATGHGATRHAASSSKDTVYVWVSPAGGAVQKIMLTGAIGDHGTATSTTKSGKVSANGHYVRIHLQDGTFKVNAVPFNKKLNALKPNINKTTCSAWSSGSGNVTLFDGTGAYAGISGTIRVSTSFALLFPKYTSGAKKGTCKLGNHVRPTSVFHGQITGSGKVSIA